MRSLQFPRALPAGSAARGPVPLPPAAADSPATSARAGVRGASLGRAALAAGFTAAAFLALRQLTRPGTWTHDFFFERSLCQWLSVFVFGLGLAALGERLVATLRAARVQRVLEPRDPAELLAAADASAARAGAASARLARLRSFLATHPGEPVQAQAYGRQLAEEGAVALDANYGAVADAIQILPLIGFAGTVLGLSEGLYQQFLTAAGSSASSFASSIATAFDTTLMGLACTIALIVMQRPLRRREEGLLAWLDGFVDRGLIARLGTLKQAAREQEASQVTATVLRVLSQELQQALIECSTQFGRQLGDATSAVLAAFKTELRQVTGELFEQQRARQEQTDREQAALRAVQEAEQRQAMADAQAQLMTAATRLDASTSALGVLVREALEAQAEAFRDAARTLAEQQAEASSALAGTLRDHVAPIAGRVESALGRKRRITVLDEAEIAQG